ncbi:hypothetical protein J4210_00255 [Candidatus Woesearchaeota archaeon]|nr:hypothetical protein [Candidatus Woesearchaeota archaeon]
MFGRVSKKVLTAVGSKEFPDAWISFVREFKRFKKAYGQGSKGFKEYRPEPKDRGNQTVDVDREFRINVSELVQLFYILRMSFLKAQSKGGISITAQRGTDVDSLQVRSTQRGRDLASLDVVLREIRKLLNLFPETISSIRSPAVIGVMVERMEKAIKKAAALISFIHSNAEAEKKNAKSAK